MPPRLSLRTVPPDRRSQMDAIRRRENESLVAASKAEAALDAAERRLAELVASHHDAVESARADVGVAYQQVVDAFGSQSRAAEYLGVTAHQLKATLALIPTGTSTDRSEPIESNSSEPNNPPTSGSPTRIDPQPDRPAAADSRETANESALTRQTN